MSTITSSITNQAGPSHGNDVAPNKRNGLDTQSTDRNNHRRLCCQPTELSATVSRKPNRPQHRFLSRQSPGLMNSPANNRRITPPTFQQNPRSARTASVQIMDQRMAGRNGGVRSTYTDKSVWAKKKVFLKNDSSDNKESSM